jgi:outer membrane protein, heavy metal efflux system
MQGIRTRQTLFAALIACSIGSIHVTSHAAPSLKDAVESAWAKHPLAQSRAARLDQNAAKRELASSWLADSPRISLSQKTDRLNQNNGAREYEADISAAIQMPALRDARTTLAERETAVYEASFAAEKWRLAGEVREAYWQARFAAGELVLAERKVSNARSLSADVARRLKAGDVARTDSNQAEATVKLAEIMQAEARAKSFRAERVFLSATGLTQMPDGNEREADATQSLEQHPQLLELTRNTDAARAQQAETSAHRRDPPEISLGTVRERSGFGESSTGSVVMRLTVPLASGSRNRARLAEASAARIEAETRLPQARTRIKADIAAAKEEIAQAKQQVGFAEARFTLIRETHQLLDKAYKLGELDLAARLRAEADRFDAELGLSRARIELSRSVSRFNQSSGFMP